MKLVADKALEESSIVANCQMNRERNLSGSNGYDIELRFDPVLFLRVAAAANSRARWLDLCCGTGKARVSREVAGILEQSGTSAEMWGMRTGQLQSKSRLLGSYFTTDRSRLAKIAGQRGCHHLDNLVGTM